MGAPRASDVAEDQRLPWWLRRQVGWALLLVLAAVVFDTTLQVATVEAAHRTASQAVAAREEPAAVAVSGTVVRSSGRTAGGASALPLAGRERRRGDAGGSRTSGRVTGPGLEPRDARARAARRAEQRAEASGAAADEAAAAQVRAQREAERAARVTLRRELRADRQLAALLSTLAEAPDGWVSPVSGSYRITATFGAHGSMWSNTHTGVDLAAPTGTPVRAVAAGTVTFAAENGAYGLRVAVRHEDGTETWYAHLSRLSVTAGQDVEQGAPIGAIGATGNVTGPHLHLELRPGGGDPVDPVGGLRSRGAVL